MSHEQGKSKKTIRKLKRKLHNSITAHKVTKIMLNAAFSVLAKKEKQIECLKTMLCAEIKRGENA